jgi:hypothetical protein
MIRVPIGISVATVTVGKTACYVLATYNCVRSKLLAQTGTLAYKPARSRAHVSKRVQTL